MQILYSRESARRNDGGATIPSKRGITILGDDSKSLKIHHLVKAPANTPWAKERQQSWDASFPATVYSTPEMTIDGTPCSAVTVILRTKGCHWWWSSGCTFCGYFNDTRDDVTSADLHSQWEHAKEKFNNFEAVSYTHLRAHET